MKDWPLVLKLFETYVPTMRKMVPIEGTRFRCSDKYIIEHILLAYKAYLVGQVDNFIHWCEILVAAIPVGIDRNTLPGYETVYNVTTY